MAFPRGALLLAILASLSNSSEAAVLRRGASEVKKTEAVNKSDEVSISPALVPGSDKAFFKKDFPYDKRPVADPFHFAHPYPVVQDSGDFDRDYVKDENSDNGNWKAQETYDRLRAKLAKEKRDLAAAYEKKHHEEQDLADAKQKHYEEGLEKDAAEKKAERLKSGNAESKRASSRRSKTKSGASQGKAASDLENKEDEVDDATEKTKDAVDSLEDCKRQLAEARKHLKEVMTELEEAKAAQEKADAAADAAAKKELAASQSVENVKHAVDTEHEEYQVAKKKYDKAEAELKEYEAEMKVAAAKVQKMRDSEDADGGVYPATTAPTKSSVVIASSPGLLTLLTWLGMIVMVSL